MLIDGGDQQADEVELQPADPDADAKLQAAAGQLVEKFANESEFSRYHKQLLCSANSGTVPQLKIALNWLCEKQDYKMMGKDPSPAYKQLKKGKLVESHYKLIQSQLESQALQGP